MNCRALLDRSSVIILDLLPKLTSFLAMLTPLLFQSFPRAFSLTVLSARYVLALVNCMTFIQISYEKPNFQKWLACLLCLQPSFFFTLVLLVFKIISINRCDFFCMFVYFLDCILQKGKDLCVLLTDKSQYLKQCLASWQVLNGKQMN